MNKFPTKLFLRIVLRCWKTIITNAALETPEISSRPAIADLKTIILNLVTSPKIFEKIDNMQVKN
jgi:hypothetical protein